MCNISYFPENSLLGILLQSIDRFVQKYKSWRTSFVSAIAKIRTFSDITFLINTCRRYFLQKKVHLQDSMHSHIFQTNHMSICYNVKSINLLDMQNKLPYGHVTSVTQIPEFGSIWLFGGHVASITHLSSAGEYAQLVLQAIGTIASHLRLKIYSSNRRSIYTWAYPWIRYTDVCKSINISALRWNNGRYWLLNRNILNSCSVAHVLIVCNSTPHLTPQFFQQYNKTLVSVVLRWCSLFELWRLATNYNPLDQDIF